MQNHISRAGRKELVLDTLKDVGGACTAWVLAKKQGCSKSPNFISILEEMVIDGQIVCQWAYGTNRQATRLFSLPEQVPCLM